MRLADLANTIRDHRIPIGLVPKRNPIHQASPIDDIVNRGGTERMGVFEMAVKH